MNIILQPMQVSSYWEVIKHAAVSVNEIEDHKVSAYCIDLLCRLYSNKLQCMLSLNSDRMITSVWIIEILKDKFSDESHGVIHTLYAYQKSELTDHQEAANAIGLMMLEEGCTKAYFETNNDTIVAIAKAFGAVKVSEKYVITNVM